MNANLDAKTIARNIWQDSMRDGLTEMMLGFYFLLTASLIQADLIALFVIFVVFIPAVVKKMKERFTYPRIGYVKFPEQEGNPGRRMVTALIAAAFALALAVFLSRAGERIHTLYKWVPLIPALLLAMGLSFMGQKTGFTRFYAMAILSLVIGLVIPFINLPGKMDNIALYLFVTAPVFLVWGAVIFIRFLQTYPLRDKEAE